MTAVALCLIVAASCFAWVAWDRRAHRFEVEMLNDVYRAAEEVAEQVRTDLLVARMERRYWRVVAESARVDSDRHVATVEMLLGELDRRKPVVFAAPTLAEAVAK